jgi:replication factor C small subunit
MVRDRIKRIAFAAGEKIILLDEADSMTEDAQHALRRIMERAERARTTFILTANEEWKIIDPVKSRCATFPFRKVLKNEGVVVKLTDEVKQALLFLVDYVDGDLRKALNILETLITSQKTLTVENIKMLLPPQMATRVLELALSGRVEEAVKTLEDLYLQSKLSVPTVVDELYRAIKLLNASPLVKVRLFERLAETEGRIRVGCNPLIQLMGFIASAYAYSALRGEVK